jgi:hypothetical protein
VEKGKTKVAVWVEDEHAKALEEVKKVHGTPSRKASGAR